MNLLSTTGISKISEHLYGRKLKTQDNCFWSYISKTIVTSNLQSRKVALIYSISWNMFRLRAASFFMRIKMLLQSKNFPGNWQRKYCSRKFVHHMMKANVRHQCKSLLFHWTNVDLFNPMKSSCSKNSKYLWWSHVNSEFSWQYKLSWRTAFLIVIHFSVHYQSKYVVLYFK